MSKPVEDLEKPVEDIEETSESEASVTDDEIVEGGKQDFKDVEGDKKDEEIVERVKGGKKKEKTKFGIKLPLSYRYNLSPEEKVAISKMTDDQKEAHKMSLGKLISEYAYYDKQMKIEKVTAKASSSSTTMNFYVEIDGKRKQIQGFTFKTRVSTIRDEGAKLFGYPKKEWSDFEVFYKGEKVSSMSTLSGKAFTNKTVTNGNVFVLK